MHIARIDVRNDGHVGGGLDVLDLGVATARHLQRADALVDAVTFVAAYVVEDVNLTICLVVDKWICALVLVEVLDDRHIGLIIRKNHVHVETP